MATRWQAPSSAVTVTVTWWLPPLQGWRRGDGSLLCGDGDAAAGLLYRDGDAVRWWEATARSRRTWARGEAEASAGVTAAAARQRRWRFCCVRRWGVKEKDLIHLWYRLTFSTGS
jgi:hypothetical protein